MIQVNVPLLDADKNRVGMTMNGDDYSFVYDTTAGIPAVIEEVQPGGSVFYIREPGGELIARVDGSDIRYYHFDELGSTRMLTDGSGTVTDRYVYDAWGNTLSHSGSTDQPYQYVGRLGYYTHHQDPEFHLMQLGVRFYDAEVGRFTSRDPIKNVMNDYAYCKDNPRVYVDPTGLFSINDPNDRVMLETYLCQFACLLDFLGLPVKGDFCAKFMESLAHEELQKLIEKFKKRHAPRDLAKEIMDYLRSRHGRDLLRRLGININGNTIRKALDDVCGVWKVFELGKLAKCMWDCNMKNYRLY